MLPPYMLAVGPLSASCSVVDGSYALPRRPLELHIQEQPRLLESFIRLAYIFAHVRLGIRLRKGTREPTGWDLSPVVLVCSHMLPAVVH